jgi:predicted aspartyl protease
MNIIFILLFICFICIFVHSLGKEYYRLKHAISFKESMDLLELPVVTFYCGDKKLNFLLDTGSNTSYINSCLLEELPHTKLDSTKQVTTAGGIIGDNSMCTMEFYYNKKKYLDTFVALDLNEAFNDIKESNGVQLHGLLGSLFFEKYKYILDFKELKAYAK